MHIISQPKADIRVWQRHGEYAIFETLIEAILSFWNPNYFNWDRVGTRYDRYRSAGNMFGAWYDDLIYDVHFIVEIDGKPVPVAHLQAVLEAWQMQNSPYRPTPRRQTFRKGPVESIGGRHNWNGHRQPATKQERTLWFAKGDAESPTVKVRASRSPKVLPTNYSDIDRHYERCWKSQRRTQWKPKD